MTINQRADELLKNVYTKVEAGQDSRYFEVSSSLFSALSLVRIFWPDTTIVEDAVFITLEEGDRAQIEDSIANAQVSQGGSLDSEWREFVESFNRFEVRHFFRNWPGFPEVSYNAELLLAEAIVEIWSAMLSTRYSDRTFTTFIEHPVDSEGACVVVRQIAPLLGSPGDWGRSSYDENS